MTKAKTASKTKSLAVADDAKPAKKPSKAIKPKHEGGMAWRKGITKYTPEQLDAKCIEYLDKCDELGRRYTQPGLALHLGLSIETMNQWLKDEDTYHGLSEPLKKAYYRMSDEFQQGEKAMDMFLLKQPCYGGYADRQDNTSGGAVTVNFSFITSDGKITAGLVK